MIVDCGYQIMQLQKSQAETDAVYQTVKSENNKVTGQIATAEQREADMRDKIKILYNEIEVFQTAGPPNTADHARVYT